MGVVPHSGLAWTAGSPPPRESWKLLGEMAFLVALDGTEQAGGSLCLLGLFLLPQGPLVYDIRVSEVFVSFWGKGRGNGDHGGSQYG